MSNFDFTAVCAYCSTTMMNISSGNATAWKAYLASNPTKMVCFCASAFMLIDDGDPSGNVTLHNVSQPRLDSLNVSSGPRAGGNAVFILGEALDIGDLIVKFGDEPSATVDQRTSTTARVVVPPATYHLNVAEHCLKLTLSQVSGTLSVNEAVTAPGGLTGTIRKIEGGVHWIYFNPRPADLSSLVGLNLVGGGSGGVYLVTAAQEVGFEIGENVTGEASSVLATVRSTAPLRVVSPTGGFSPDELVRGLTSGALVKLTSSPAYSGVVDVTVENEHGQRLTGGSLLGAYTYA